LAVEDPGLNFGRDMGGAKVQKVPTLAKHSVKQRKTMAIGGGKCPLCPSPGSATASWSLRGC